ncbi:hypothetical protein D3C87_1759060 [compost metagenome]
MKRLPMFPVSSAFALGACLRARIVDNDKVGGLTMQFVFHEKDRPDVPCHGACYYASLALGLLVLALEYLAWTLLE